MALPHSITVFRELLDAHAHMDAQAEDHDRLAGQAARDRLAAAEAAAHAVVDAVVRAASADEACRCRKAAHGMWTSGYDARRASFVRHRAEACVEYIPASAATCDLLGLAKDVQHYVRFGRLQKQSMAEERGHAMECIDTMVEALSPKAGT